MANIDRLARAENELKTVTKQLEEMQNRVSAVAGMFAFGLV